MGKNDSSVKEKLLSESRDQEVIKMTVTSAVIEYEKSGKTEKKEEEGDLRLFDLIADSENLEEIEALVSEEPRLIFERDSEGGTPLHSLCLAGDENAVEVARIILGVKESENSEKGFEIERPQALNLQDSQNATPLHLATLSRVPSLVEALVKWGANLEIQDGNGNTPLHLVASSNSETAITVAGIILSLDRKKGFINLTNNEQFTPLHVAISKKAVKMMTFLLQEKGCNLSMKNSFGRTAVHFAASGIGESDKSCETLKALLEKCTKEQVNQADNQGRTPLISAAIQRYPKIVKILVEDERVDVTNVDEDKRTALHLAAMNGCYTKGFQCVEALLNRKFKEYPEQVKYLFKMEDKDKTTPFMYACVNCPADTMQKYVGLCPNPQYWLSSLYLTLLYKHCPLALKPLMDKSFSEREESQDKEEDGITTDFGILTGYVDPVEILPQQETKYLKQALWWDYDAQKEILQHPLTHFFILKKWQKLRWIIASWIFWQLIWLTAYTSVGLCFYTDVPSPSPGDRAFVLLAALIMLIYTVGSVINECFEMFTVGTAYVLSITNLSQMLQCGFAFIAVFPIFTGYEQPNNWMKYTTATGILLAYILSMRDIGKLHSEIGLTVEVLKQVLIQIMQVLISCAPLWIGFTIAFIIIFHDQESLNSKFPGPIVKILVMMTGEFEYNETFKNEGKEGPKIEQNPYIRIARLIFFLSFLIAIPVGFFNLLTGFALDKVMELRERAKVARVAKQLEHIYFVESMLLSLRPFRKIFSHSTIVSFIRRMNVTSKWFNTETGPVLKFETFLTERIRNNERNFGNMGFKNKLCKGTFKFLRSSGLSKEVMEQIYSLAAPPPNSD